MKMRNYIYAILTIGLLLALSANGVQANSLTATQQLPPLPDWPIIGPLLRQLGIVTPVPDEPDSGVNPDLPEYRINTMEDINALGDIPAGTPVRVIASEDTVNSLISQSLEQNSSTQVSMKVAFADDMLQALIVADKSILDSSGLNLPFKAEEIDVDTTTGISVSSCHVLLDIKKLSVNGWSFFLRHIVQRAVNTRIPEIWPEEICVQNVILMENDIAIEGYRVGQ